jgi:hypothetical protein
LNEDIDLLQIHFLPINKPEELAKFIERQLQEETNSTAIAFNLLEASNQQYLGKKEDVVDHKIVSRIQFTTEKNIQREIDEITDQLLQQMILESYMTIQNVLL